MTGKQGMDRIADDVGDAVAIATPARASVEAPRRSIPSFLRATSSSPRASLSITPTRVLQVLLSPPICHRQDVCQFKVYPRVDFIYLTVAFDLLLSIGPVSLWRCSYLVFES